MFFPVRIYTPEGKLKEEVNVETLTKKYWKDIDIDIKVIKQLQSEGSMKPAKKRVKIKETPLVCAIWPMLCARPECNIYTIKRSSGGKYCSMNCRRLEANRKKRDKNKA